MFEHRIFRHLAALGVGNGDEREDDEGQCKHSHSDVEHQVDVHHLGVGRHRSDECTDEQRRECSRQRVKRAADHVELVTAVAATTNQVEHRVDNGVEHTDAEARDEGTQQVDHEAGHADGQQARAELYEDAHKASGDTHQGRLLITNLRQHLAGGDSHEEVSQEVHGVTEHTDHVGAARVGERIFPDDTDRCGEVRYERDHRIEEEHGDDGHPASTLLFVLSHRSFSF